jgi:hypothetical protein
MTVTRDEDGDVAAIGMSCILQRRSLLDVGLELRRGPAIQATPHVSRD